MITIFRQITAQGVILPIVVCVITAQINQLYIIINVSNGSMEAPFGLFIVCIGGALMDVIILMLGCGMLADVWRISIETEGKILSSESMKRCKWFRKFHKSCQTLRISFGGQNFLEPLTPPNFEHFVVSQTVNLLLLKN